MDEYAIIERVDLYSEFMDAFHLSRAVLEASATGDDLSQEMWGIYPKLRFIMLNAGRYVFASRFLRDSDCVLDVPCGTGYGSVILASNGNEVLGMDIHKESVDRASDLYRFPNLRFVAGDMMKDTLPPVDFITCLDGLEHVTPGEKLIQKFAAALSENGRLVVTVPVNEQIVAPGSVNEFHKEEYDEAKLKDLLSSYFSSVRIFGHDLMGTISDRAYSFDGIMAVCEV